MNEHIRKDEQGKFSAYNFYQYFIKKTNEKIDFTSVVKKLKKQNYNKDNLEGLIQKFKFFIMERRKKAKEKKGKRKLDYGVKLYKFFDISKLTKKP